MGQWRLKTEQELLAEGWQWIKDEDDEFFDSPARIAEKEGAYLVRSYITGDKVISDQHIEKVMEALPDPDLDPDEDGTALGDIFLHRCMFIESVPLVPLCNCSWNKHPLFCKC